VLCFLAGSAEAQDPSYWRNSAVESSSALESSNAGTADLRETAAAIPPDNGPMAARSLQVPAAMDAEVAAMAQALGAGQAVSGEDATAKALRIFNWVRNNLEYECYHGLRKGPALTLLEGTGNDLDQCALLVDLLKSAGYPAADLKLLSVSGKVDYDVMRQWIGLAETPYPGKTFQQVAGGTVQQVLGVTATEDVAKRILWGYRFLESRGCGVAANSGKPLFDSTALPDGARLIFDRTVVEMQINGEPYYLDPAYKVHESLGSGMDLTAASGYERAALLTQAGGTADANTASGLSQTAVNAYMTARATALHSAVGTNSMEQTIGGRKLADNSVQWLWQAITLVDIHPVNGQPAGTFQYFTGTSDPALEALKSTVRFQYTGSDPLDYTLPTADLKGSKISLTFTGNVAELRLDDVLPASEAGRDPSGTLSGNTMDLTITVTHPTLGGFSEKKTYKKATSSGDPYSYAIIYGFNTSERLLQKRHEQLRTYKDASKAEDSREVRTELLNIMGLTWLRQTQMLTNAFAAKNRVITLNHHRFGRVAQEEGFYIDVGLQYSPSNADDGLGDDGRSDRVFNLGSLFWSAMEHGVIQQMQVKSDGTPYDAVSTVNILRTANQAGGSQKVVLGRDSNWNTVKPTLTGYDTYNGVPDPGEYTDTNGNGSYDTGESWADQTIKQNLEWLVLNKSAQVLLPQSASVTQGIWTGSGWVIRSPTLAGMIISGGYAGGYATSIGRVTSPPVTQSFWTNPATVYQPPSIPSIVKSIVSPTPFKQSYYGSDPVDMATGGFVHAVEDLMTGLEEAPRGLGFTRDYSSNTATRDDQHLGYGWSHNLHIRADSRTAEPEMLGMGSPRQAAVFLAAVAATSDLYRTDATPKEWAAASLVTAWMVDQMRNSGVSLRIGRDIHQFIAQPDGTYTAPSGSTMTLAKVAGTYQLKQRLGNTIHFDTTGKATKIADVDGREMTFTYHTDGRIDYVQDHVSRRYTFGYDSTTLRITSITDSTTPTRGVEFRYDLLGNLDRSTDPEGKYTYFDYEVTGDPGATAATEHKIVRLRNHDLETIVQNVYDPLGRVERQFLYGDTAKTYRLYYTGRDNYEVDPQGGITHYLYDEKGRAAGKRDARGNLTTTAYDGEGRVASRTTATGEVTEYTYDGFHNLKRIDHPRGGGFTLMDYDSLHRLDLVTDPHGVETDYVYFTSGNDVGKDRPQQIISAKGTPDQSTVAHTYFQSGPAVGRVASITDGDGLVTNKTYDANGQPDITTAPGGFLTDEDYDARGDLRIVTDPNARVISSTYNKRRQVTETIADQAEIAAVTGTTYDNQGRTETITPPADNAGQRPQQATTYTATDKVRLVKLAGTTLSDTAYDSRDWSENETDAAERVTHFIRHANGDMNEIRKPGNRTTSFQYDGDNRLTSTSNPGANSGGRDEVFTYGTTTSGYPGTLKDEADAKQTLSEFDRMGRLRFFTDRKNSTFENRYDALGRHTHSIPPQTQGTVTEYTNNGRIERITQPSGDTATYAYNPTTGRPASVTYSGTGGGVVNLTSYDDNGNLLSLNENGANTISRTYDGLNRVTSYTHAGQTIGYRYYSSGKLAKLIYLLNLKLISFVIS
jgi:YD repeat-containing protein